jgi:probable HAF family extracellular repeat protein
MASTVTARRRLGVLIAGAVAFAAFTVNTAGASAPTLLGAGMPGMTRPDPSRRLNADPNASNPFPAFLLDQGRYTTIAAPDPHVRLFPFDINNRGQITGEYLRPDSESGFLRDRRGRITVFDIPGARGTEAIKLNDRGQIVGEYSQDTPFVNDSASPRDYLLDHRKVTTIEIPGAVQLQTDATGLNNRGQVVGQYLDTGGAVHGFLWDKGRITTIDLPGATGTSLTAINDRGQLLGVYLDAGGSFHGFVLSRGRYTSLDAPGNSAFPFPLDINDRGQIVGYRADDPVTQAGARGFLLARGAKGPATPISFPGAPRTVALGINDQGQIVGAYEKPAAASTPSPTGTPPMARTS